MLHVTYLIILLPLVGFAIQATLGRRLGDPWAGAVATFFIVLTAWGCMRNASGFMTPPGSTSAP